MYNGKRILGLIPARGGSKGVPGKNIKLLAGKPLIAWTIKQAKSSKYIDEVIVSTDDEEIRDISRKCGAEVPFLRPKELAQDNSKIVDVILHLVEWFDTNNEKFDMIAMLQPTSPLRSPRDINTAVELLFTKNAQAIISMCEVEHNPLWVNTLPGNRCLKDFLKEEAVNKNRQELRTFYWPNGAIYLFYCDYIRRQRSFWGNETYAYIMPRERSIDIDDEIDFEFAELLLKNRH